MRYGRSRVEDYKAGILTDRKDGEEAIESYSKIKFDVEEFIVSGEGSDTPFNVWKVDYYLLKSTVKNIYALKLIHYGDPDNISENPYVKTVAILPTPLTDDEDVIVNDLLEKYWDDGGYQLDEYVTLGRFKLII